MLNSDEIISLYKEFVEYLTLINDDNLTKLILDFDELLLLIPNSIYDLYGGCYEGGWLLHCMIALKISDREYKALYLSIQELCPAQKLLHVLTFDKKSVYKTIILSNISKLGLPGINGINRKSKQSTYGRNTKYDYNLELPRMKYEDRSIYLANKYSIQLNRELFKTLSCASRLTSDLKLVYFIDYLDLHHLQLTLLPTLVTICNLNAFKFVKFREIF